MAFRGTPYRVFYKAKNLASGLTGIYARVTRPDNSITGTFPLVELSGALFSGCYYFDFPLAPTDLLGSYMCMVYSPLEAIRAEFRIDVTDPIATQAEISTLSAQMTQLITLVEDLTPGPGGGGGFTYVNTKGFVHTQQVIAAKVESNPDVEGLVLDQAIEGEVGIDYLEGLVQDSETQGRIESNQVIKGSVSAEEII